MDKEPIIDVVLFGKDNKEIKLELPEFNHLNITCKELISKLDKKLNLSTDSKVSIDKIFSLSLVSKYLELPLKESYKPFGILICWDELLKTFSPKYHHLKKDKIEQDQPILSLQRSVFLTKLDEQKIDDEFVLKLLYEEAKSNVLDGKYQVEAEEYLAAIQLRIDYLRTKNDLILESQYFKNNIDLYLSVNYLQSTNTGSFLTLNRLRTVANLDQKINSILNGDELVNLTIKDLYRKYLTRCHELVQYGSVFFHAQIEKNLSSFSSFIARTHDFKVWIAINYDGIHFIDKKTSKLHISFNYGDFLWELAIPQSINENPDALPCLFIEINEENEKKIMQIFSKQAKLIDNALKQFDEKFRTFVLNTNDVVDSSLLNCTISSSKSLKKDLSFCSCATFNKKGDICVKKQGSFKFVKKIANP